MDKQVKDTLRLGGQEFISRLFLGTGKFRTLALHDAFSYDRLGTVTSTKDWFRRSNIKNFDEFYVAIQDTVLADYCFVNCKQLETISLPTNLVYLDNTAFKGCTSLREINVFGVEPAQLERRDGKTDNDKALDYVSKET